MTKKQRLDAAVAHRYPDLSRSQIQSFIMQGLVTVDGDVVTKSGVSVADDCDIIVQQQPKFVSRAGYKLEAALDHFAIDVTGKVVLDAGISTGGFTDCLLQKGAAKVYGVDVGVSLVHERIARDPRVILLEKTNLRHLESLPEKVDLVTLDVSFISLCKVIPAAINLMKERSMLITLIKPQFEAERDEISKGGIVRDQAVHERIIASITDFVIQQGFSSVGFIMAPLQGVMTKNKEFVAVFVRGA